MDNKRRIQQLSSVEDPLKVKVLILADQKTTYSDFYFITRFTNIVKLDLSYNKLNSFPVGFSFRSFTSLRTLFLHYNKFNSIKSVQSVNQCIKLEYLTLFGNPLQQTKTRHYFVNQIASLKLMDDKVVKIQERNPQIITRYDYPPIKISFPIITVIQSEGSSHFLSAVISELMLIRSKYIHANPILKIQRWYRNILSKKNKQQNEHNKINKVNQTQNEQIRLETDPQQRIRKKDERQRLVTQKLTVHKSNQQIISSIMRMNFQFSSFLKQKSEKKVFAMKQFCDKHKIKYQTTSQKLYCLRSPKTDEPIIGKTYLQYIVSSNQKYLLRRRGSQESMNSKKKYAYLQILMNKKINRQPLRYKNTLSVKPNQNLSDKIEQLHQSYCNKYVLVKQQPTKLFTIMKQHYYKSMKQGKIYPFCLQEIVERSAAAVSIQRLWKGYLVRKKNNVLNNLIRHHSAWLIQRFLRNVGLKQRHSMFINIADYLKKQTGSNQLIIPIQTIFDLKKEYQHSQLAINFGFLDQKFGIGFDNEDESIYMIKSSQSSYPKNILQNMSLKISPQNDSYHCQNILDLIFKNSKSVKYFSVSTKQNSPELKNSISKKRTSPIKQQLNKLVNKSKSKLNQSSIIIKSNPIQNQQLAFNKNQLKKQQINQTSQNNYIVIEYKNSQQSLHRKFIIALITYRFISKNFTQSCKFNLNQSSPNAFKNINQRINDCFFLQQSVLSDQKNNSKIRENRMKSKPFKIKLFVNHEDLSTKAECYYPVSEGKAIKKIENSITLPIRTNEYQTVRNSYDIQKSIKNQIRQSARISQTDIKIFPNEIEENDSASNFMSYRQFQRKYEKRYMSIYDGSQNNTSNAFNKQKSLQKSQSLQPTKRQGQTNSNRFVTVNLNKGYTTEHMQNATQTIRNNRNKQDSIVYSSVAQQQKQSKKRKITLLKQSHKARLQQNNRYKRQQLSKLRQKISDQLQINNRIMQSNRLEGILSNARKHSKVKMALQQNLDDVQRFQRDFLKRGNSSIRKEMIKFQNDRSSSKSPDNQSIYNSRKSLQEEDIRNNLRKKSQKIFNLKTQIKQFSIDASEGDQQMSLGAIEGENNKSKALNRRNHEQQKVYRYQSYNTRQMSSSINSKNKELKKKRLVHSVFPEEFYPLKESKKIGFQLPRINRK